MRHSIEMNKHAVLVDFIQVQRDAHKPPLGGFFIYRL